MLILSLPGAEALADALGAALAGRRGAVVVRHFPDGESLVRLDAEVGGEQVVLAACLDHPDDRTLALLFAADAARELGASRVGLVVPYLPYMRQDHRFQPGEAVSSRSYARLLSASLDWLVTVDPHLHRWTSLDAIYTARTRVVQAAPAIAAWLRREVPRPLLVGPDSESAQWVQALAALLDAPWTVLAKTRLGDHDVRVAPAGTVDWSGRTPVLVDDIISTGATLVAAAEALRALGTPAPLCVGVHALFDEAAHARLLRAGFERVVTCDTVPHASNAIGVAPLLAEAVRVLASPSP